MKYKKIEKLGIEISSIALGTWGIGAAGWGDVKIVTCSYAGDENCNEGELKALNDVSQGKHYTACMLFLTDIIGPSELEEVSAWEKPNEELKDYGWWLAREDGGAWELVTHGYC